MARLKSRIFSPQDTTEFCSELATNTAGQGSESLKWSMSRRRKKFRQPLFPRSPHPPWHSNIYLVYLDFIRHTPYPLNTEYCIQYSVFSGYGVWRIKSKYTRYILLCHGGCGDRGKSGWRNFFRRRLIDHFNDSLPCPAVFVASSEQNSVVSCGEKIRLFKRAILCYRYGLPIHGKLRGSFCGPAYDNKSFLRYGDFRGSADTRPEQKPSCFVVCVNNYNYKEYSQSNSCKSAVSVGEHTRTLSVP